MNAVIEHMGAVVEPPLTATDLRAQVNLIQSVMQAVMKEDIHYGVIPGCKKPSLYKPGAEKLCATFHIAPSYKIEDLSTADCTRYRVVCVGTHQATGIVMGEGAGTCSSNEEKYKWRYAVCDEEFEETPENRRRIKFGKSRNGGFYKSRQVRTEHDEAENTILKMACKRANIAMTISVTAASDIFSQDIEDLPEHLREIDDEAPEPKEPIQQPRSKSEKKEASKPAAAKAASPTPIKSGTPLSDGQKRILRARMESAGVSETQVADHFKRGLDDMAFSEFADIQKWIMSHA